MGTETPIELMDDLKCENCGYIDKMPYSSSKSRINIQTGERTTTYTCPTCGHEKVM